MPSSSPGFVGSRLREARETRQITAGTLAEMLKVSPTSVSAYENGHFSPSPEVLDQISAMLNYKTEFFFRREAEPLIEVEQTIFERSRASATRSTRRRARHYRIWLREILQYLAQFVVLPEPNLPSADHHWFELDDTAIEDSARNTRRYWKLGDGPISNVTLLAEKNGIIVTMVPMNATDLDAFSTWDHADQRPYIVLGTDIPSPFRTRYSICHELGHLVLHREVTPQQFGDQRYFKLIESQADRFAAAFLTPATTFAADIIVPTLDVFRTLKSRWRVSIKMMVHRAQELGILNRAEARGLYISYNRRGWNRREPLDEESEVETARLVRRAFEAVIENSVLERSQVVAALPFNREDIEQLASLPHGYLDDESAYNQAIRALETPFT